MLNTWKDPQGNPFPCSHQTHNCSLSCSVVWVGLTLFWSNRHRLLWKERYQDRGAKLFGSVNHMLLCMLWHFGLSDVVSQMLLQKPCVGRARQRAHFNTSFICGHGTTLTFPMDKWVTVPPPMADERWPYTRILTARSVNKLPSFPLTVLQRYLMFGCVLVPLRHMSYGVKRNMWLWWCCSMQAQMLRITDSVGHAYSGCNGVTAGINLLYSVYTFRKIRNKTGHFIGLCMCDWNNSELFSHCMHRFW